MKKTINISIIFLILLFSCSQPKKETAILNISEKQKNNIENITLELEKLIVESIDSIIFRDYTIEFKTSSEIDSLDKSYLTFWTLENNKFTENESLLLKKLIESDKNIHFFKISDFVKEKLRKSNQETDNLFIKNLNEIVINSNENVAITIIGTYFTSKEPESIISGWEEIIIFEKVTDNWKERKRIMYVEY